MLQCCKMKTDKIKPVHKPYLEYRMKYISRGEREKGLSVYK